MTITRYGVDTMSGNIDTTGENGASHLRGAGASTPVVRAIGERRVLAAMGLLAVAVLSGFAWWLIRYDPPPSRVSAVQPEVSSTPTTARTSKSPAKPSRAVNPSRFTFAPAVTPETGDDCAVASYGEVSSWFWEHPCKRVVRGLYTTSKKNARALVSVIVVTMPSSEQARELKVLTDTDGTGNVADLQRDGSVQIPGAPDVAGGEYASDVSGNNVTIVEAEFFDGYQHRLLLAEITREALRVATSLR